MPDEFLPLLQLLACWVRADPRHRFPVALGVITGGAFAYGVFIGWIFTLAFWK